MRVLGIDPGPTTHGAVLYDDVERRVVWSNKAATRTDLYELVDAYAPDLVVIERPAAMGAIGSGSSGICSTPHGRPGGLSNGSRFMRP